MFSANEHLKKSLLRIEQHKNQKALQQRREKEARRKMDIRRYIIIGELVCKYFPEMLKCQPQKKKSDNAKKFADFEDTLRLLASNKSLLVRPKGKISEMISDSR